MLLDEALLDIDSLNASILEQEEAYLNMLHESELEIDRLNSDNYKLKIQASVKHTSCNNQGEFDVDGLVDIISNKLTPESVITCLELLTPDRVTILDSARQSARKSAKFKHSQRLLYQMYRLCTDYLDVYLDKGDNEAKVIFGSSYAANESETVESSDKLSAFRKFTYENNDVYMFQHLSIGVAHNKTETIRVHFLVDKHKRKVVIGYCGEHLPVKSS